MEFQAAFQIDKMTVFEVRYSTIGSNGNPHFVTTAAKFIRSKRDYKQSGQCQETVLPHDSLAYQFYQKWDQHHLHTLDEATLTELNEDIYKLCQSYNHVYHNANKFGRGGDGTDIRFWEIVDMSKMTPKKITKMS